VVSRGKVLGVVSETDIVKFMSMKLSQSLNSKSLPLQSLSMICLNLIKTGKSHLAIKEDLERISRIKVKNVMTKEAVSVGPDTNIFDAAAMMERHDINRLPVVSRGKLVGIIARADLIKALVD